MTFSELQNWSSSESSDLLSESVLVTSTELTLVRCSTNCEAIALKVPILDDINPKWTNKQTHLYTLHFSRGSKTVFFCNISGRFFLRKLLTLFASGEFSKRSAL